MPSRESVFSGIVAVFMALGSSCSKPSENDSLEQTSPDSKTSVIDREESATGDTGLRDDGKRKRIAAIVTTYFPNSHAGVLVDKFLRGFPTDEGLIPPRTEIASLYIDQIHGRDIGRQIAHKYNIPLYESIRAALTLGGDDLAVDAVLLIGEHGDYPVSMLGQEMLPRRYFFEQIVGVIGQAERPIPVFNDKHLSYRWDDAKWMYETAKAMGIPLWAGSALPVVWRNPNWEHPKGEPIDQALVIGFHMVERYGFHALEILQSQVERRRGGETGVQAVQCLSGDAVWRAEKEGKWSLKLANEALNRVEDGPGQLDPTKINDSHVFLIEYVDGLRATVLMLGDGYVRKFAYAQQRGDETESLEYHTETGPTHAAFSYLGINIEDFFVTGIAPNPVERTYLTTGILEAAMISRKKGGERIETPHLATIRYKPTRQPRRPTNPRPSGASITKWSILEPGASPAAQSIPIGHDGTVRGPQSTRK